MAAAWKCEYYYYCLKNKVYSNACIKCVEFYSGNVKICTKRKDMKIPLVPYNTVQFQSVTVYRDVSFIDTSIPMIQ